ncbi:MAG: efflux RND transporter periplasmic adaptor subunit, partial [Candidatus Hydrogenedentes bacterium]|nr:efflux RND transporter periplasmic adaptor subunit [Candidatus Hydrogenedentota bacterium]
DLNSVWVKPDAYESHLSWIHYGQTVSFTTESYPGEVFEGKIAFIDPVLDKMTRTVKVRVNVANPDGKLKPEMFVRAVVKSQVATGGRVMDAGLAGKWIGPMHPEIIQDGPGKCNICGMALVKAEKLGYVTAEVGEDDMPLVVPATAPLLTGTRAIVYVEVPDTDKPTFEGREIVLGARAGDFYIVKAGLQAGERVVTNGSFKIDSALQILAKPSMMTPDGGGGEKMASQEVSEVVLTFTAKEQLTRVGSAYQGVLSAFESGDRSTRSSGLTNLSDALDAVDMTELSGDAHMAWMEYAARLKNDVAELRDAKKPARVTELMEMLQDNSMALFSKLGLSMTGEADGAPMSSLAPEEFQAQLGKVYEAYLSVQQSLASDDQDGAKEGVTLAQGALKSVDMALVTGDSHMQWMKQAGAIEEALAAAEKADSIEVLRTTLAPLSEAIWSAAKAFGLQSDQALYQAHCPMALDGEGANWLQMDTEVSNPYYGSSMLSCGSVVDKFAPMSAAPQGATSPAEGSDHK